MSSKLLSAVVGVGIALGASSACTPRPGGLDVPPDDDAFCDTTWPITKGGEHLEFPACIDPYGECTESGPEVACIPMLDEYTCEGAIVAATCVEGAWQCEDGQRPARECKCWGAAPPGYACTEDGLVATSEIGAGGAGGEVGVAGAGG